MGWDAFADDIKGKEWRFKKAALRVKKKCGTVDGLLMDGGLDCSDCAMALGAATGMNAWDENGWPPELVKALRDRAYWPDNTGDKCWAYESARELLNLCADIGSGITFSY